MTHQDDHQLTDSVPLTGGGVTRIASNLGETTKRIKLRGLHSQGTEATTHSSDEHASQITPHVVSVSLDLGSSSQLLHSRKPPGNVDLAVAPPLDLNRVATAGGNAASIPVKKHTQIPFARCIPTDLNAQDVSECGSATTPATVKDKDPFARWNEMKQNGFLSSPHHGLLPGTAVASSSSATISEPKQRPKKSSKTRVLPKKKMESAKVVEHTDRFAKIAAPSGLLNGLNLGIINHVRNKKQVHSIIEALLRSETPENGHSQHKRASHAENVPTETIAPADTGKHHLGPSHGTGVLSVLSSGNKNLTLPIPTGRSDSSVFNKIGKRASVSHDAAIKEVELLGTEVFPLAKACEGSSTFSNEASANTSTVSLLSTKAANAAAQWLELLNQDIKGRLPGITPLPLLVLTNLCIVNHIDIDASSETSSALRQSKKRVRSVITTELPFLISKEFSTDQENIFCYTNGSSDGLANNTLASMHLARWTKLFDQMDESLSEEEKQLESWLYDVREMQLYCDRGLQNFHLPGAIGFQRQETLEYNSGYVQADRSTMELAVRAAAASIYSTCHFIEPKDNVSCF